MNAEVSNTGDFMRKKYLSPEFHVDVDVEVANLLETSYGLVSDMSI